MKLIPTAVTQSVQEELETGAVNRSVKARQLLDRVIMHEPSELKPILIMHGSELKTISLNLEDHHAEYIDRYAKQHYLNRSRATLILLMHGINN